MGTASLLLLALGVTAKTWQRTDPAASARIDAQRVATQANRGKEAGVVLIHGAISGVIPRYLSVRDGLGQTPKIGNSGAAPMDGESQKLAEEMRKASRRRSMPGGSMFDEIWNTLFGKPLPRTTFSEPDVRLGLLAPGFRDSNRASELTEEINTWSANLRADLQRSATAPRADGDGPLLVPIFVPEGTSAAVSSDSASLSTGTWNTSGMATLVSAPALQSQANLTPVPVNNSAPAWNEPGGAAFIAPAFGTLNYPAPSGFIHYQPPVASATRFTPQVSTSTVVAPAPSIPVLSTPTVPSTHASLVSPSVPASGGSLVTSSVSTSGGSGSTTGGSATPLVTGFQGYLYVGSDATGVISQYTASGTVIANPWKSLGTDNAPDGIMIAGNNVYVADAAQGTISVYDASGNVIHSNFYPLPANSSPGNMLTFFNGTTSVLLVAGAFDGAGNDNWVNEYNLSTGALIKSNFLPGTNAPFGLVISPDGHILVSNEITAAGGTGFVSEYTSTGVLVKANFATLTANGLAFGMAVSGNNLLVADLGNDLVSQFNVITGAQINLNYIVGPAPESIAILGTNLYTTDGNNGNIEEYNVSGATAVEITGNLIGTNSFPYDGIAVIPEPASAAFLGLAIPALLGAVRLRRRSSRS